MAEMGVQITYRIGLTPTEFDLVQRGLRGVLDETDRADALALQERLMAQRASHLKSLHDAAQKTVDRIDAARRG